MLTKPETYWLKPTLTFQTFVSTTKAGKYSTSSMPDGPNSPAKPYGPEPLNPKTLDPNLGPSAGKPETPKPSNNKTPTPKP